MISHKDTMDTKESPFANGKPFRCPRAGSHMICLRVLRVLCGDSARHHKLPSHPDDKLAEIKGTPDDQADDQGGPPRALQLLKSMAAKKSANSTVYGWTPDAIRLGSNVKRQKAKVKMG
jgi:hypothetical protein